MDEGGWECRVGNGVWEWLERDGLDGLCRGGERGLNLRELIDFKSIRGRASFLRGSGPRAEGGGGWNEGESGLGCGWDF